jgi:putative FmdB family regulatory protein
LPTYRYECNRCDAIQEYFQSMSEKPKRKCPECGGKLTRLIGGGGGVILKGSGFYTTDYRSEGYKSEAKKDSEAAKPKAESKGDAKGAAKGDGKGASTSADSKPKSEGAGKKGAGTKKS